MKMKLNKEKRWLIFMALIFNCVAVLITQYENGRLLLLKVFLIRFLVGMSFKKMTPFYVISGLSI